MKNHSYLQRFGEVELAVRSQGKGIPFVWGHSLMGSMRVEDQAGLWDWGSVERYAEVVRYDARGHGNSDGSYDRDDYRWDRMASDMLAVATSVAATSGTNDVSMVVIMVPSPHRGTNRPAPHQVNTPNRRNETLPG